MKKEELNLEGLSFEELYKKLNENNSKLSSNELSLKESLELYKESSNIYNICNKMLEEAENEIKNEDYL